MIPRLPEQLPARESRRWTAEARVRRGMLHKYVDDLEDSILRKENLRSRERNCGIFCSFVRIACSIIRSAANCYAAPQGNCESLMSASNKPKAKLTASTERTTSNQCLTDTKTDFDRSRPYAQVWNLSTIMFWLNRLPCTQ